LSRTYIQQHGHLKEGKKGVSSQSVSPEGVLMTSCQDISHVGAYLRTPYGVISFRSDQTASSGFLYGNGSDGNGSEYAKQQPARVRTDRLRHKRDQISSPNVLVSGPFSTGLTNVGELRHISTQVEIEQGTSSQRDYS
jgi:hypothetical protein